MKAMGIGLPPYSTNKQSFNFRPFTVPEITLDKKCTIYYQQATHPVTQLAQFDSKSLSCTEEKASSQPF